MNANFALDFARKVQTEGHSIGTRGYFERDSLEVQAEMLARSEHGRGPRTRPLQFTTAGAGPRSTTSTNGVRGLRQLHTRS
jgi:hypothetical protein